MSTEKVKVILCNARASTFPESISILSEKRGIITLTGASDVKQLQTTNFAVSDYIVPYNCIHHKI